MNDATAHRIDDAAQRAGTTPGVLRVWQYRYGWPMPTRHPNNGYRYYPTHLVEQIRRMVQLTKAGYQVSDLIVDGLPVWPEATRVAAPWSRFAQLTKPTTEDGKRFAAHLEGALRRHDVAAIQTALHSAFIVLRPGERLFAAWMPAVFGAREWELAGKPLQRDVPALVRRLAGDATYESIDARWMTALAIGSTQGTP